MKRRLVLLFTVSTSLAIALTSLVSCEPSPCYDTQRVWVNGVLNVITVEVSCYDLVNNQY